MSSNRSWKSASMFGTGISRREAVRRGLVGTAGLWLTERAMAAANAQIGVAKAAFFKALPNVPQEEFLWRFHFMMGALSYAISGADALRILGPIDDSNPDAL